MIVAVADVLDNSIADGASEVHIQILEEPVLVFACSIMAMEWPLLS